MGKPIVVRATIEIEFVHAEGKLVSRADLIASMQDTEIWSGSSIYFMANPKQVEPRKKTRDEAQDR